MRIALLAALLVTALAPMGASADTRHLRVLFLGNSLTYTNDLPAMVSAIAAKTGRTQIEHDMFAPGGWALEDHWAAGTGRQMLADEAWDAVVLQQGPSSLPESGVNLTEWTKRWADEARAHGVRPALLTVWPEQARSYAFGAVISHHRTAARAAHTALFPAGVAWQSAFERAPKLRLYGPDGFHPSPLGTYLTAVVVYAGLTGELPRPLPRIPGVTFDAKTAGTLRAAAATVYR
jgi:hypothetical protein